MRLRSLYLHFAQSLACTLLIIFFATMSSGACPSDDDFVIGGVGRRIPDEDSDDDMGGFLRREGDSDSDMGGIFGGGMPGLDSDSDMGGVFAGGVAEERPGRRGRSRRRRRRVSAQTSGGFWAFVTEPVDGGRHEIFGLVDFSWQLAAPDYTRGKKKDLGSLVYRSQRQGSFLLDVPVEFPIDEDIASPMASVHALRLCRDSWIRGAGVTVNALLTEKGVLCNAIVQCTIEEAAVVKAGEEGEWVLRTMNIKRAGRRHKGFIDGHPSNFIMRRWRQEVSQAHVDAGVVESEEVPEHVAEDPLLFIPASVRPSYVREGPAPPQERQAQGEAGDRPLQDSARHCDLPTPKEPTSIFRGCRGGWRISFFGSRGSYPT